MDRTAAKGDWGTVEWGVDQREKLPARDAFRGLSEADRSKILSLFKLLAVKGRINNREKFRQLGQKAKGEAQHYWEFKSFQDRFIGDFRPGRRFVVTAYAHKKADKLDAADIERAVRVMHENVAWEEWQRPEKQDNQAAGAPQARRR